jgi:uncharacterized protein GlcG (DUF336 family)
MLKNLLTSLVFGASFCAGLAVAQAPAPAPAPVPDAMPFDIPYGTPIGLDQAKRVADAAMADAKKRNWKMAISIVEPSGDLIYFQKMDGTQMASIKISQGKARAAAIFRRPTQAFFEAMESGHPYVATLEGVVGSPGGIPLIENGKLIGAIGVSGGTGGQDAVVAKAGADTVK